MSIIKLSSLPSKTQYKILAKILEDIDTKPTAGMIAEAKKGLAWRKEFGRGGQEEGVARARDIQNGKNLSESTIKRMYSFFARHEIDKKAEGFRPGEKGFPSKGRIAWALWGGDAGYSWSTKKRNEFLKVRTAMKAKASTKNSNIDLEKFERELLNELDIIQNHLKVTGYRSINLYVVTKSIKEELVEGDFTGNVMFDLVVITSKPLPRQDKDFIADEVETLLAHWFEADYNGYINITFKFS